MADAGRRQIRGDEPLHSLPRDATMLTSPAQSAMPEVAHGEAKVGQGVPVARYSVVSEVPAHNGFQPRADRRNRVVHTPPQFGFHLLQLGLQPFANRLPQHREPSPARLPADVREAEKVEGFRFTQTTALSVGRRMASELHPWQGFVLDCHTRSGGVVDGRLEGAAMMPEPLCQKGVVLGFVRNPMIS